MPQSEKSTVWMIRHLYYWGMVLWQQGLPIQQRDVPSGGWAATDNLIACCAGEQVSIFLGMFLCRRSIHWSEGYVEEWSPLPVDELSEFVTKSSGNEGRWPMGSCPWLGYCLTIELEPGWLLGSVVPFGVWDQPWMYPVCSYQGRGMCIPTT